jgi:UDPglucose 6-dehydrogenase
LSTAGHDVLGVDVDHAKLDMYRNGSLPFYEPGLLKLVDAGVVAGKLRFLHVDEVTESLGDVILIATGTPSSDMGAADLGQVRSAIAWVTAKQPGHGIIVMKSTVPPGTGVRLSETVLQGTRLTYVSNPEFLREGRAVEDWCDPDRIVIGGTDDEAIDVVKTLYEGIDSPQLITDITSAEMMKYASNAFLATRISFINEIAALCDRIGATIDDVTRGMAGDPRIGSGFLGAGVGYGGSCFPKDVRALDWLALTNNHSFELLKSVITVNNRQRLLPLYALRNRLGHLDGVTVGVLGLSFKPQTDDMREAPALDIIRAFVEDGACVKTYDPVVLAAGERVLPSDVRVTQDLDECVEGAQALVLMTEWPEFLEADWERLVELTNPPRIFFDGRNALDPARIKRCGFEYIGVGRGTENSNKPMGHPGMRPSSPA